MKMEKLRKSIHCLLGLIAVMVTVEEGGALTPPACGGQETNMKGSLLSPLMPGSKYYYPKQTCKWDIPRKYGYRIVAEVVDFRLESISYTGKCNDYVSFNYERVCGALPKGTKYGPYEQGLEVEFVSDAGRVRTGFNITYWQEKIPICKPPCDNDGTCIKDNVCGCKAGFAGYRCKYTSIQESSIIKNGAIGDVQPRDSCAVYGQKNVRTFDGNMFSITTSCEYALLELRDAKVAVTMKDPEDRGLTAIKKIAISRGVISVIFSPDESGKLQPRDLKGRLLNVPNFFGTFEMMKQYEKIRIKDEDFIVDVDEDGSALQISAAKSLQEGSIRGLCGNYNGNISDDMMSASGNMAQDVEMFALVWNQDKSCLATTGDISLGELQPDAEGICNHLRTPPFAACLAALPVDSYYAACMNDMALCGFGSRPGCNCASTTQYARDCARAKLSRELIWREGLCEKPCPSNQIFSECAPSCAKTCRSLGTIAVCSDECADGCTCPGDTYWDGSSCVEKEDCPCHVGEVQYAKNEKFEEKCRKCECINGTLECESKPCDGTALVFGNPYFLTFDGLWYTFDGTCSYTLMRGPAPEYVRMIINPKKCGAESASTCIDNIIISSEVTPTVKLVAHGSVSVDDQNIDLPYIKKDRLEISALTSSYIVVNLPSVNVRVKWSDGGIAAIYVPHSYQGKLGGLLGNFNGKTTDEYLSPSGIVESTPTLFAQTWEARTQCDQPEILSQGSCKLLDEDRRLCHQGIYYQAAFQNCLAVSSDEEPIKGMCQEKACTALGKDKQDEICKTISVFALLCASKGHVANWRNDTYCSVSCANGKVYEPWGTSCGRTCRGLTSNETCKGVSLKAEGCLCPRGKYENKDGTCVDKSNCDCYYGDEWRTNGALFIHEQRDCGCVRGVVSCSAEKNVECGTELQYKDCAQGISGSNCQPTCGNKNPVCAGKCVSGCGCPEGQYLHGGKCFREEDCPCTFEGKDYFHNDRVIDDCDQCTCNRGQWTCEKTNLCTGACSLTSGSYYKTFDDSRFHSRGTCKYLLMSDKCPDSPDDINYFEIYAQSHPCEDSAYKMCNLTIHARFGNDAFILSRGHEIREEFSGINSRYFYDVSSRTLKVGFYQVIEADFFSYYIQLRYDMKTSLSIEVSKNISIQNSRYGRKLCGLCGDMDGSSSNDFMTKNGHSDPISFINEWRVDECPEIPREEISSCMGKPVQEDNAKRQCMIITGPLFKACHNKINPKPFYDTCIEETCTCDTGGQCECYCSAVSAYAEACGRRGAKVNWRLATGCPVECREFTSPDADLCDIRYDPCKPCVKTCCSRCAQGCFEGCFPSCKDGLVFNPVNQTCIPEENCICPKAPTYIVPTTRLQTSSAQVSTLSEIFTTTTTPAKETTHKVAEVSACLSFCRTNVGKPKHIGESWREGCLNLTCVSGDGDCLNTTKEVIECEDPPVCQGYEARILVKKDDCDCDHFKCECNQCTHEGKTYNLTEKWQEGDCVTMVCDRMSCPNGVEEIDKRKFCPQTAANISCPKYYKETQDNSDPCCPSNKCVCDTTSCPEAPSCVAGVEIDHDRSNECCTVHKCQPTCVYNGAHFKNGSRVSRSQCFEQFCRCNDEKCSVNKENEITCSDLSSKPCMNDDTEHFGSFSVRRGCCTMYRCNCECRVYGDPHYHTFDGSYYTFPGVCPYTLVKYRDSDDLHIIGDNEACGQGDKPGSCLKRLIIHWKTIKIVLSADGDIEINGENLPKSSLSKRITRDVRISERRSGEIFVRIRPVALSLFFQANNGVGSVDIKVPMSKLYNKTVGLCGTCSNDRKDDFETSYGNQTNDTEDFGHSWQYNKTQKSCQPCRNSTDIKCLTCHEIQKTTKEADWPKRCSRCPESDPCAQLRHDIFNKSCTIKTEQFEKSCYLDQDNEHQCSVCNSSSFIQYADNCGKCVKWRTMFNCTQECPVGQVYKDCVSECDIQRSCENRNAPGECEKEESSGCGCPDGMVFLNADKDKCVEEKCCECPEPTCKDYEVSVPLPNQNPDNCCAEKSCQCKEMNDNISCTAPKKPHITEKNTPGCNQTVCDCPAVPECPVVAKNCSSLGCIPAEEIGDCGCTTKIECKCNTAMCPPMPKCDKCHKLDTSHLDKDTSLPCGGNCCPIGKCLPVQCPAEFPQPKNYTDCPFLQDQGSSFELDDKNKCCPKSFEPICVKEKCDVLKQVDACPEGYTLQAKKIAEAANPYVTKYSSCPDADKCCNYKECVCTSCADGDGKLLLGQERFEDDGCKRISCNVGKQDDEGCYNVTVQMPTCPKPPVCECYQHLQTTPPSRGAKNMGEWLTQCCPNYTCEDSPCTSDHASGPDSCVFPSKRTFDYLKIDKCLFPHCQKASCECDLCLDSENRTHIIGAVLTGTDKCENRTCIKDEESECPAFKISREECVPLNCNDDYEDLKSELSPSACCPEQECICKPESMLQEICEDYKNDTSTCSDPQNMVLQESNKYYGHKCCPEKECVCKPENQLQCDSKTCGENYDRVKTSNASQTNCCPEYECVCNCEKQTCPYETWVVSNGHEECKCECKCEESLCNSRKPNCLVGEHLTITGRSDGGCCPVYKCECNTSVCTPLPSANCTRYQIEYPWKESKDDCCPTKNKCKCDTNSEQLQRECNETLGRMPSNCTEGWEPYVASVMASEDDTMCCDTQCRCVSCHLANGTVVEIGKVWEETRNCKIVHNVCSDKKLTNGCHKIISSERDVLCEHKSLGDFEEQNCESNTYAVQVTPQEGCCPSYQCANCTISQWSCDSYTKVRTTNGSTNHRCPGECICARPMTKEQNDWCFKKAKCAEFEVAISPNAHESRINHEDECCPPYKCVCAKCPSSVVTKESLNPRPEYCEIAVVRPSDNDMKCCKNYEIQCSQNCSCTDMDLNCTSEESACIQRTTTTNICKCPLQVDCVCHKELCPVVQCDDCEVLSSDDVEPDATLPCNGNCCPKQKCTKKSCPEINDPVIAPECTFLEKHVDTFLSDKCCPVSRDIHCSRNRSTCPYTIPEACDPGFELEIVHASDSNDTSVQAVKHCPMVDQCCSHKVCVCKSCVYNGVRLNLGGHPVLSADGCAKYTCNQQFQREDGCYEMNIERPECPPRPLKECYQVINMMNPARGAKSEDEWSELCCAKFFLTNKTCSRNYDAGPDECPYPAVREITYETINGCKKMNCPVAKCECTECVDWNNMTHPLGSEYHGENPCDTFTCMQEIGSACPKPVKKELNCPTPQCNSTYEMEKRTDVDGKCCPDRTCECKSAEMLKKVCDGYRDDTSTCADPGNMELRHSGKFIDHQCCPHMDCVCKERSQLTCPNNSCTGKFNKLVKISNATETQCCNEYACECDCSEQKCQYESWTPKSDSLCSCTCECDKAKCVDKKPTCREFEDIVKIGTKEGDCCPVHACNCNETKCPTLASANCNIYQIEYDWKNDVASCCPVEKRCKCNPNSEELKQFCNSSGNSLSEGCKPGYEPYIAEVTADGAAAQCCKAQCRCTSCITEDGEIKEVGSEWTEEKDCEILSHRCSSILLENTCHGINTKTEKVRCPHSSLQIFESVTCKMYQYAVENETEACCPEYSCVPCETQTWDCESPNQVRQPNSSNSRCPGNCTCVEPMVEMNIKACHNTAGCGPYEKPILLSVGESGIKHPDHCCPDYKCVCDTCPNGTVTKNQVQVQPRFCEIVSVRASDAGRNCCQNFEVSCNTSCLCQDDGLNCNTTIGCWKKSVSNNKCGCPETAMCLCNKETCPKLSCALCEELVTTDLPFDTSLSCGGNCCPELRCVPKPCPTQEDTSFAPKCTHLKEHKLDYQNDTCCPTKEIVCKKTSSCPYQVLDSCREGYSLETSPVASLLDDAVSNFTDCPMIDECCPHRTCVCDSCKYPNGTINVGDEPIISSDGCTRYTCTRGKRTDDGCYELTVETPKCPPSPQVKCHQSLKMSAPRSNAGNETNWVDRCCTQASVEEKPCGQHYDAGPDSCTFPEHLDISYKVVGLCKYEQCPIRKCICDQCVDANNNTHPIGSTYPGENACVSYRCLASTTKICIFDEANMKQCGPEGVSMFNCTKVWGCCYQNGFCFQKEYENGSCPIPEKKTPDCPVVSCDEKYETVYEVAVKGECCPNRTCICKTEDMLKDVCDDFDNDTAHCSDPPNMEMVVIGSQPSHSCCPLKKCRCKDVESRNCTFSDGYVCPVNYTTVLETSVSSTNCCPKYRCDCNCSALTCNEVQVARSSAGECNCRCECDYSKCPVKPTCGPNQVIRQAGTIFDGCCTKYQCVCNNASCLSKPAPSCSEYQEMYMVTRDGCCEEEYCRCKNSSEMLEKGCSSADCDQGYVKSYRDDENQCCGYCTCNMCITEEGNFTVGEWWNVTENHCSITKICSTKKQRHDGCHKAEILRSENDTCSTAEEHNKLCSKVEEAVLSVALSQNSCCDQYRCQCSKNTTKLRDVCFHYDGMNCSQYKQSSFVNVINCCPVYECQCKDCVYSCPYGFSVRKNDTTNSTTDGCCFEYTCECDRCFVENRTPLLIGEIWTEELQSQCYKNHTCAKDEGICKTVIEDPSESCTSLKEYEANHCDVPFQKALPSSQSDPAHPCCIQHQCVCNDTNECPYPDSLCLKSQRRVMDGKMDGTGGCCENYTCVCQSKEKLKDLCDYSDDFQCAEKGYVPVKINSTDPCCPNYTCSCDLGSCEKPNTECPIGMRLVEVQNTGCCPNYTCQCSHCVSKAVEHKLGTKWTEDSCNVLSCVNNTLCPRIESVPNYSCNTSFDEEDCKNRGGAVRGTDDSNGCCKECSFISPCHRVEKRIMIERNISGMICRLAEKLEVGDCVGVCPSFINFNPLTGEHHAKCGCCTPDMEETYQMLSCERGGPQMVNVNVVRSCGCGGGR